MTIKTYENWNGSLNEYLQIGDLVDEELVNHFINTLPPATLNNHCIQMGEPYSHVNGKATYSTLINIGNGWEYAGNCHRGEVEEPEQVYQLIINEKGYENYKVYLTDNEFYVLSEFENLNFMEAVDKVNYFITNFQLNDNTVIFNNVYDEYGNVTEHIESNVGEWIEDN